LVDPNESTAHQVRCSSSSIILPETTLKRLDIEKTGASRFKLASGEVREHPVGEAYIEIESLGATSLIMFGPEEVTTLLGVTSLELLGLQVDVLFPVSTEHI